MAFLVSPGVLVKEIDLTNVVPSTSSTIGAMAGAFQWVILMLIVVNTHLERVGESGKYEIYK